MTNKDPQHQCVFVPRLDGWEYCECGNKVQVYDPVQGKHIDNVISESGKIMMLAESGFTPTDLQVNYLKLINYCKQLHENNDFFMDYPYSAYKLNELLKEIGEL